MVDCVRCEHTHASHDRWKLIWCVWCVSWTAESFEWKRNDLEMCFLFAIRFDCNLFKFHNSMRMNELNESHNQISSGIINPQNANGKLLFIRVFCESRWIVCFPDGVLAFIGALFWLLSISAVPRVLNVRTFLFSRRNFYLICTRKKITTTAAAQAKNYWKYFSPIRKLNYRIDWISSVHLFVALQQSIGDQWPQKPTTGFCWLKDA